MTPYDGPTLRAIRESMHIPLRRVARLASMSHGHLSKVERGEHGRPITPAVVAAYEKATGVSLADAAAAVAEQGGEVVGKRGRTWRPGQLTDMRRLAFNAAVGAIAVGGQTGEPLGRLIDSTGRPITPTEPDHHDTHQLTYVADLLTALDMRYGGAMTSQLAKSVLRWAIPMVEPAGMADQEQQSAYRALGAIAARAAWAAFDTGSHEAARSLHRLALFCAVRANDPDLRAHVVADAAAHHNHLGYHHDALDLIRIVEADERTAPPVRMAVHGVKARAYAHTGDIDNCRRHLALAEQAQAESAADEPVWVTTLRHPAHLHATSGHALAALAEHSGNPDDRDQAHQQLAAAVDTFDPYHHARAVSLCQARIAVLHLTVGECDHGETWARRALATLDTVRSARLNRALAAVRNAAAEHPDHGHMATLAADIDAARASANNPYST